MNILITGANGQLGREMRLIGEEHKEHNWIYTDVEELDITDFAAVSRMVEDIKADVIVNCAAYTNVDKAEEDEQTALKLNADAVEVLSRQKAKVVHISTDYVFSGSGCVPYKETDTPAPMTAYGRTKLEGENRLLQNKPDAVIIRTAWLYSEYGNNFVKTMLRLGKEKQSLGVVYDQVGTPTYALDLARAIYSVITAENWQGGVYHFTNEGVCSWYDFTREIFRIYNTRSVEKINAEVKPILSSEYAYKTPRPHYSVLDKAKIKSTFGISIPYWTEALDRCIRQMI